MAKGIELKLDAKALARLQASGDVAAEIERVAEGWLNEANDTLAEGWGYRMAVHQKTSKRGRPYVVARVYTVTKHAENSNAKYQTLARIVGK